MLRNGFAVSSGIAGRPGPCQTQLIQPVAGLRRGLSLAPPRFTADNHAIYGGRAHGPNGLESVKLGSLEGMLLNPVNLRHTGALGRGAEDDDVLDRLGREGKFKRGS